MDVWTPWSYLIPFHHKSGFIWEHDRLSHCRHLCAHFSTKSVLNMVWLKSRVLDRLVWTCLLPSDGIKQHSAKCVFYLVSVVLWAAWKRFCKWTVWINLSCLCMVTFGLPGFGWPLEMLVSQKCCCNWQTVSLGSLNFHTCCNFCPGIKIPYNLFLSDSVTHSMMK